MTRTSDIQAELDAMDGVYARYARHFGEGRPIVDWQRGTTAELDALMEEAIERNRPLTSEELRAVQGMSAIPPGAVLAAGSAIGH